MRVFCAQFQNREGGYGVEAEGASGGKSMDALMNEIFDFIFKASLYLR